MAKSTRYFHIRRLQQAAELLDTPLLYIKEFCEVYEGPHPQLAQFGEAIAGVIIDLQDNIRKLKESL